MSNYFARREQWLAGLAVGDTVAYSPSVGNHQLTTIARTTATRLMLANGVVVRRKDGRPITKDRWSRANIEEATAELMSAIIRRQRLYAISQFDWKTLDDATLAEACRLAGVRL